MRGVVEAEEEDTPAIRLGNPYNRNGTIIAVTNIMNVSDRTTAYFSWRTRHVKGFSVYVRYVA